jgi:hypothetical protein
MKISRTDEQALPNKPSGTSRIAMRGQILPRSEMKSLYGSITSSAVMSLSYVEVFTAVSYVSSPKPF